MLGLSRNAILSVVRSGAVTPGRGSRGAYQFSFPDLLLLRTARALAAADIPPRRITRSLRRLRDQLPAQVPLSGLRILADGDRVVVQAGAQRWQAETGQYLLALEAVPAPPPVAAQARDEARSRRAATVDAPGWVERANELETIDPGAALRGYRKALALDSGCTDAYVNLGRLLHQLGRLREAEQVYRAGLEHGEPDALLQFNLGVLLDDLDRSEDAIAAYGEALVLDPRLADAHYNLSLLYEKLGKGQPALKHLREYRKLSV